MLADTAGAAVETVFQAAALTEARRRVGAAHLDRLRDELGDEIPLLIIPELFIRAAGRRVVTLVAESIRDEL
jgi:hypothetical protein